jgi:hypothetical protein
MIIIIIIKLGVYSLMEVEGCGNYPEWLIYMEAVSSQSSLVKMMSYLNKVSKDKGTSEGLTLTTLVNRGFDSGDLQP